jgi:fatty acyl-CoA reductase
VTSSYKQPVENWVDSYGTFGFTAFFSLGLLRVILYKEDCNIELVPVDLVTSAMIACAWDIPQKDPIPVYNYVSSIDNPTRFIDFLKIMKAQMYRYPLSKAIWMPTLILTTSSFWYSLFKILCNRTVAILCDMYYILTFKKPKTFVKVRYLEKLFDLFGIFTNTSWKFTNGNVKDLWHRITDEDRIMFPFDIRSVKWDTYYNNFSKGIRIYLLKDPLCTLPEARIKMKR